MDHKKHIKIRYNPSTFSEERYKIELTFFTGVKYELLTTTRLDKYWEVRLETMKIMNNFRKSSSSLYFTLMMGLVVFIEIASAIFRLIISGVA